MIEFKTKMEVGVSIKYSIDIDKETEEGDGPATLNNCAYVDRVECKLLDDLNGPAKKMAENHLESFKEAKDD